MNWACQLGLALIFILTTAITAEDLLLLKTGERYEGKISRVNDRITVITRRGKRLRFTADEVRRIYRGDALVSEYKKRRGRLGPGEFRDELKLAQWCFTVGLLKQSALHIKGSSRSVDAEDLKGGLHLAVKLRHISLARLVAGRGLQVTPNDKVFRKAEAKLRLLEQLEQVAKQLKAAAEENQKQAGSASRKVDRLKRRLKQPRAKANVKIRVSCRTCRGTGSTKGDDKAESTMDEGPGDCRKCNGRGHREVKTALLVTFTADGLEARITVAKAILERMESADKELTARAAKLREIQKALQAAILTPDQALPKISPAMLVPPMPGGLKALQKGFEEASSTGDCERLVLEALRQGLLKIAVDAAQKGQKYQNANAMFRRIDQLGDGLKTLAEAQQKSTEALDRQLQKLDNQTRERATIHWMLANYRDGYLLDQYGPCPTCRGLGEILSKEKDEEKEKRKRRKRKKKLEPEEEGVPCTNCSGNGLTIQAVARDRKHLEESIKKMGGSMKRDQAFLAKLLDHDNGVRGMIKELGAYLATGEGELPMIKRSSLQLPTR